MKRNILLPLIVLIFNLHFFIFSSSAQPCTPNPSSIDFNGISSFVRINSLNGLEMTNQLTVEAWIYPKAFASGPTGGSIVCKHAWGVSMYGWVLRCGGNGQLSFNLGGLSGASPVGWKEIVSDTGTLVLNTWQHVAATFDGTMLQLYINGAMAGNLPFVGTINPSTGYKVRIGALADTVWGMSRYFNGYIDEVRVWNRSLMPAEIISGMDDHIDPALQTGLVGYWRFNESSGSLADDLGTGNNHGTLVGGTWTTQVPFNNNSLPNPTITWVSPNLVSSYTSGNQWYFGTTIINGATQQTYAPTQYGYYKVVVTDTNGCTAISLPFYYNTTGIISNKPSDFSIQPNPARENCILILPQSIESGICSIFSLTGELVSEKPVSGTGNNNLDVSGLKPGLYVVRLIGGNQVLVGKMLINR